MNPATPRVSVVLPTYNRRRFLPAAFEAIAAQRIDSCEIVIVDDGSTDDTKALLPSLAVAPGCEVRYIHQANQGAYGARNTGVAASRGEYIAFYDSDDVWLPHHLPSCLAAFEANPDVDWVYAACELVDFDSGRLIDRHTFYVNGQPRPFMALPHETRGTLRVITGGGVRCQIDHGLYCGLQNSVLRRRVFDRLRFASEQRNEAEDQLFAIRAVAAGFQLAYIDAVHVRYHVHAENSSGAAKDASIQKRRRVYEPLIAGYEQLASEVPLSHSDRRALRRRIARELFWHLGYAGYLEAGDRAAALQTFRKALKTWPWNAWQWKTYLLTLARHGAGASSGAAKDH